MTEFLNPASSVSSTSLTTTFRFVSGSFFTAKTVPICLLSRMIKSGESTASRPYCSNRRRSSGWRSLMCAMRSSVLIYCNIFFAVLQQKPPGGHTGRRRKMHAAARKIEDFYRMSMYSPASALFMLRTAQNLPHMLQVSP